jgi:hypothetical protein
MGANGRRELPLSPVLARVVASLAVGGLAFLVTTLTGQSLSSTIQLSVFIGGLVLVVQYLSEFERRLAASAREQSSDSLR